MDTVSVDNFVSVTVPGDKNSKISIKTFVESKKLTFVKGSGFYQLSKAEIIQQNKQILVQRLSDPKCFITGKSVKEVLGIGKGKTKKGGKYTIDEGILKEFKVFVESTSYNRNLIGGTTFLYRKDETDPPSPAPKRARRSAPSVVTATTTVTSANAPKIVAGATNNVEIVFSFDTTGSMYPCLSTVRSVIRDTLKRLTTSIPSIRIGIIAHGDYCDKNYAYITDAANNYKLCPASDVTKLIDFVTNVGQTGGGDFPECYELVLREVGSKFDWSDGANKSLVLIGDAPPHNVKDNPGKIDWRVEAQKLKDKGIRVYSVQALDHRESNYFYKELAQITMGFHLKLHQFSSITDFLVAVCYREGDNAGLSQGLDGGQLAQFEGEVNAAGRMVNNLRRMFDQLSGRVDDDDDDADVVHTHGSDGLSPVSPSRFQVLTVDEDKPIKQFAQERGLIFKVGRGFYEFTKPEAVSDKKEIVLMDKTTGDFYNGWAAAREFSGIVPGKPGKQMPKGCDQYVVFIQSTSYNRKLIAGQRFLYEVDTDH